MHCTGTRPDTTPTHSPELTPSVRGNVTVTCGRSNVTEGAVMLRVGKPGWVAVAHVDEEGRRGICEDEACPLNGPFQHVAVAFRTGAVRLRLNEPDRFNDHVLDAFEAIGVEVQRPTEQERWQADLYRLIGADAV